MIKKIILFIIIFLSSLNVEAEISNVSIVDQTINITGSGFGTHADYGGEDPYLNYLWEQCDYSGSSLTNAKWANKNSGRARLSNSYAHSGGYSLSHRVLPTAISEMNCFGYTVSTTVKYHVYTQPEDMPEIFTSEWILLKDPFEMSSNDQAKLLAIVVTSDGTNIKNWMHIDTTPDVANPDGWYVGSHVQESDRIDSNTPLIEGVWARLDMYLNRDTGLYQCWVNGTVIRNGNVYDESGYAVTSLYEISFINYMADYSGGDKEYFTDDMFVNFTRARVEIGDNAVYANCTHREIQPALTWSDTGITGTFNQGSFKTGDKVYFFVIDENGIPSDGYPVTIGGDPSIANPVVEILTESGQTTTASILTITGTATADTGQTISGVTCSGQTVTPDDGTWDEQAEAFTCLANLALGENTLVFVGSDGTRTGQDSIAATKIKKTSKINGSATIKNATIHQ